MERKNTTRLHKITLDSQFTQIPNKTIKAERLSAEEVYLIVHLISLPEGFSIHKSTYWKKTKLSKGKFNTAWNNLVEYGYIREKTKFRGNLKAGYDYDISYLPIFEVPNSDVPDTGSPVGGLYIKKDSINKDTTNKDAFIKPSKEGFNRQYNNTINTNSVNSIGEISEGLASEYADLQEEVMKKLGME